MATFDGGPGPDTFSGTPENDLINGNGGDDTLSGVGGNDLINGGAGDDTLDGGADASILIGGTGNDLLGGALGDDLFRGGRGSDTAYIILTSGEGATIDLSIDGPQDTGGVGVDTFRGIENLIGSGLDDILRGNGKANRLSGHDSDDTLSGGAGADALQGGRGDDTLSGGAGADVLNGGNDADRFVFETITDSTRKQPDLILDLENRDTIDVSAIDADAGTMGDQAFMIVDDFTGQAGELAIHYRAATDQTKVSLDTDGDARADSLILVSGNHQDFTDFIL